MSLEEIASVIQCYQTMFQICKRSLEDRGATPLGSNSLPFFPPQSTRTHLLKPQSRMRLPLKVNNHLLSAHPDSGAQGNFISEEKASDLDLEICRDSSQHTEWEKPDGTTLRSVGTAVASCRFALDEDVEVPCLFHVLSSLPAAVIIGSSFLEETRTLISANRFRLQSFISPLPSIQRVNLIQRPDKGRRRLACKLDGVDVLSIPDTGSDLDLLSEEYVQEHGHRIIEQGQAIQQADGSVIYTSGKVIVSLTTADGREFLKIPDVLPGLQADLLLGENTLKELNAFDDLQSSFVNIPSKKDCGELNILFHLGDIEGMVSSVFKRTSQPSQSQTTDPAVARKAHKNNTHRLQEHLARQQSLAASGSHTHPSHGVHNASRATPTTAPHK